MADDPSCPPWWRERAIRMGEVLASPLVIQRGTFSVPPGAVVASLLESVVDRAPGASSRLAIYREQVWKRLFVTLQGAFPRTTRFLGAHRFNRAVMAVLAHHRRASRDLADVTEPVHGALLLALGTPSTSDGPETGALRAILAEKHSEPGPLLDCVRVDEAERRGFRAAIVEPRIAPAGSWETLAAHRAALAPSFSLVRVEHDVVSVERVQEGHAAALRATVHVSVVARSSGVVVRMVDPVFARLLAHASVLTLGEALARTRSALDGRLASHLDRVRDAYLRDAFAHGFWTGLTADPRQ
jgi:hypothetical protein